MASARAAAGLPPEPNAKARQAYLDALNAIDPHIPDLVVDSAKKWVAQAQALHDGIGTTVGAVAVEGPEAVADAAAKAGDRLRAWLDELAWWLELGRPHRQRTIIVESSDHVEADGGALHGLAPWSAPSG
ncbi:hypothetical protein ABZY16_25185 [Streptomyces sp. NPDC006553]|uniref:hypothetical protein n=1 Tax=Streptomyces sp. NPDC006553 TaxID=3157180 RepID=UPI0033B2C876